MNTFTCYAGTKPEHYGRFESAYGEITSRSSKVAYVTLDNDEVAISYNACNLRNGTRIICSVLREATKDRRAVVVMDSVCNLDMVA